MADKNMLERIFSASASGNNTPSLGSGLAQNAKNALEDRGYQLHLQESKQTGETPLSYEEWKKQNS
jgi:hypothetical protein